MTAVEWFYQRILAKDINAVFEQAKEMEKQQIIDAWNSAYGGDSNYTGYEYYKETFKTE